MPRPLHRSAASVALSLLAMAAAGETALLAQPASKARLRLEADRTAYAAGERARLAAVVSIDAGWHVNSHWPTYDYLIPTELTLEAPPGWTALAPEYPPGEMQRFAFAEEAISVYDGEVVIWTGVEVPAAADDGAVDLVASLRYQACDDRRCLPPTTAEARLALRVGAGGAAAAGWPFDGSERSGDAPPPAGRAGTPMLVILLLGLVGGLILNAMPCVLPVLSLKVFGLVKSASEGRAAVIVGSLATAAGILASFWALALAAVLARRAGAAVGWGVQFQEPTFVAFLAIVVLLFSLNLWGLFEIPLPGFVNRLTGSGHRQGVPGHFVSGLFATLMATPCSAPFLGTAVGFALAQPPGTVFAVFSAVGAGMALPYLALATTPAAINLLPKPGAWMERFKGLMGFLLAGAAIWLFYVLSSQMTGERLAFLELSLLVLALFVWMRSRAAAPLGRRLGAAGVALAIVAALALAAGAERPADPVSGRSTARLITWAEFDRTEAERIASGGGLVFVDVTADWCFTCKVNERLVLETREVADLFERHGVVPMKADWTNRDDTIAAFLAEHGRYGIPFYLLYRPGAPPHLFGELLTKSEVIREVEAASSRAAALPPGP